MVKLTVLAAVLALVVLNVSGEPLPRERDRENRESPRERESVRTRREPPSRHHYGPPQSQASFTSPKYTKGYRGSSYGPPPHSSGHHSPNNSRYGPPHKTRSSYKSSKNSGRPAPPDSYGAPQTYPRPIRASSVGSTKSSYGPPRTYGPSKSHHYHHGKGSYGVPSKSVYHHKTKYSSHPKPIKHPSSKYSYSPSKSQSSSEYSFKPSTPYGTSTEYKSPSSSSSSSSYDSSKLYNSYGESPSSGNHGATWYTSPTYNSGSSSSDTDANSYDASSLYSSTSKSKPSQEHATYTEIQPSVSYTLPASFETDTSKSTSNAYNRGSSRPITSSSYKTSTSANSYQAPIAHGGAATSYVSVSHDDSPSKHTNYGTYSGSGTQAVVTSSYRAPSSTYSQSYTSSKTPHVYSGSYKTSSPSSSYSSQDIQPAASTSHETAVNQFKPTNNFSFLPYKQQATSQVKDASVGLSPDEWESYYGSPSSSYQEASTQVDSLSPSYYDPVAAPLSEKSTSSSTSRKKDITRVHQKMLQQSSSSQSQSSTYSKPNYGYDTDSGSSTDARSR